MKWIFRESAETLAKAHTCVARSMISAVRDFGGIINETQLRGHVAQLVHIVLNLPKFRTPLFTDEPDHVFDEYQQYRWTIS